MLKARHMSSATDFDGTMLQLRVGLSGLLHQGLHQACCQKLLQVSLAGMGAEARLEKPRRPVCPKEHIKSSFLLNQ